MPLFIISQKFLFLISYHFFVCKFNVNNLYNSDVTDMGTSQCHMFQPSRFKWETPILTGCLLSSRLISKSPVLRETSPNFQFFVKIPICIASYFIFWCFNCITAVDKTLQIHVNNLFLQWFIVGFAKYVLKNDKIIFLN